MQLNVAHQRGMNQAIDMDLNLAVMLQMTEGGMVVVQGVLEIEVAEIIRDGTRKRLLNVI